MTPLSNYMPPISQPYNTTHNAPVNSGAISTGTNSYKGTVGTVTTATVGVITGGLNYTNSPWGTPTPAVPPPPNRAIRITFVHDAPAVFLYAEENGTPLELELSVERCITAFEQMQISTLLLAITDGAYPTRPGLMNYIRKNNLERHFKISAVNV